MERRTIRTNQCWLINGITFFGEFFWLFKRAVSGKVMDVLGGSKQGNAPIGSVKRLWVGTASFLSVNLNGR